jgi:hypothetical protein
MHDTWQQIKLRLPGIQKRPQYVRFRRLYSTHYKVKCVFYIQLSNATQVCVCVCYN